MGHHPVGDEPIEVEADGVGVQPHLLGELLDLEPLRGLPQRLQDAQPAGAGP